MKNHEYIVKLAKEFEAILADKTKLDFEYEQTLDHCDKCGRKMASLESDLKNLMLRSGKIGLVYKGTTYIRPTGSNVIVINDSDLVVIQSETKESEIIDNFVAEFNNHNDSGCKVDLARIALGTVMKRYFEVQKLFLEALRKQDLQSIKIGSRVYYMSDQYSIAVLDLPADRCFFWDDNVVPE